MCSYVDCCVKVYEVLRKKCILYVCVAICHSVSILIDMPNGDFT